MLSFTGIEMGLAGFGLEALADVTYGGSRHISVLAAPGLPDRGRRLAVTKQGAAKIVAVLEERGYVAREADPDDARAKRCCSPRWAAGLPGRGPHRAAGPGLRPSI